MQVERLRLDMTEQIQQFYKWMVDNSLTATEISLWHALMYIADEAGYPIWLSVAISRLEKLTGMKKDAIYKAREDLQEKRLIEVQLGKGNQAAKYRLIPFGTECNETAEEESIEQPPMDPIEEAPEEPANIFKRMQELIPMPSPIDIQDLKSYLQAGMEDKLLCESIRIAETTIPDKKPMDKWRYAKGVMRNWFNNSITTMDQYIKYEKNREESQNGGNRKNHKRVQPETEFKESGMREFRIPE